MYRPVYYSPMLTGKKIRALRKRLGLTQLAFSYKIGVSVHAVRLWEYGTRHPCWEAQRKLERLARS